MSTETTVTKDQGGGLFRSATYRLEQVQMIPKAREEVFDFFSDAHNLERITPSFLNFQILTKGPIEMKAGTLINYRIKLYGVPMTWRTEIEEFTENEGFVDRQLSGPYALWHHQHSFESTEEGTLMTDTVRYRVRFGLLGSLAHWLFVRRSLLRIFNHRRQVIHSVFAAPH